MGDDKRETVSVTTFKKWPCADDFTIVVEDGKVKSAICKYCSEVPYNDLIREAKYRNIKGKALKSIEGFRSNYTYIHRSTFMRHRGDEKSLHNWCKKKIVGDPIPGSTQGPAATNVKAGQKRVDDVIISNSTEYYKILFRTILVMLEEELAFTKFASLVKLQKENGVRVSANDKLNSATATEMAEILCEVITKEMENYLKVCRFMSVSGDASEARKTGDAKELVFTKVLAKGDQGFVPASFLLKCQQLKKFGGGTGKGTYLAMIDALEIYLTEEEFLQKIICLVADGASVNFGAISGALTLMVNRLDWDAPTIHCLNHRLELVMKDSYLSDKSFENIKEMLDTLFRLFKNSGKTWALYQLIASKLHIVALRFTKVGGTRFQAHILNALQNFLRNFMVSLLFAENVQECGSGKDSLVTKETFAKIIGFRKKWLKHEFIVITNLYLKVLNETSHLCYNMESDAILIYQLREELREAVQNLKDLQEDNDASEFYPANIKVVSETAESNDFLSANTMIIKAEVSNVTLKRLNELNKTAEKDLKEAQKKIITYSETFKLNSVSQGKTKLAQVKASLIPTIIKNIEERFESVIGEGSVFEPFILFDISLWADGDDTDGLIERDHKYLDALYNRFKSPLDKLNFEIIKAKKEWKKVKRMIKSKYVHLKEHHQMLWCRFISQQIELFPNICMLLEILLVMLASSSMVERGFSTLRRILRENRLSMKNDRLNQTLIVRCNLPILKKLRIDCVDKIINDAVELYLVKKKWRWGIRQQKQNKEKVQDLKSIYGCPPKKRKRIDMSKTPDTTDEIVVSSSSGEDSESESESENELENFSSDDGSDSSASDSSADGIRMNVE